MKTKKADAAAKDPSEAVRVWREAEAFAVDSAKRHTPWVRYRTVENPPFEFIQSKRHLLEAKKDAALARINATRACDALEVSEGDELAVACDPQSAHDKLSLLSRPVPSIALTDIDVFRANMRAPEAVAFIRTLARNVLALQERRALAGLPPPALATKIADPSTRDGTPANVLVTLARIAADGPDVPELHDYEIGELAKKQTAIFAAREREAREKEHAQVAKLFASEERAKDAALRSAAADKEQAAKVLQDQQAVKVRDDLADAYCARFGLGHLRQRKTEAAP